MRIVFLLCISQLMLCLSVATAYTSNDKNSNLFQSNARDSLEKKVTSKKLVKKEKVIPNLASQPIKLSTFPAASLNQALKGQAAGLYIQEPSGEPGSYQYMYIRGASAPMLSVEDLIKSQPLVVVDGLPIISNEHPFAYDIQVYDYNRIGPSTNLLAGIPLENIESVTVMKDIGQYAVYGPRAANGVVAIKTKGSQMKKLVAFESYIGLAAKNSVTTINSNFENRFRREFYDRYASLDQVQNYSAYLKDSLNNIFYGPSNWTDSYYKNGLVYSANASVTGGSDRANFKFGLGNLSSSNIADDTGIDRYSVAFALNMIPNSWMDVTASINGSILNRHRNRYNRDRMAEMRYLPDLTQPMSPDNRIYSQFLNVYSNSIDKNVSNVLDGFIRLGFKLKQIKLSSQFGLSYSDGQRDVFYPTALLEGTKYISNYIGYNQRLVIDNKATYNYHKNANHSFNFELGQSLHMDTYRYNYAYAYGPNASDYIKVNLLKDNTNDADYLGPQALTRRLVFRALDKTVNNLLSFYGSTAYSFKNNLSFTALLRADASSNAQPTDRWFLSPVFSGAWNLKNQFLQSAKTISDLKLRASAGMLGRVELNDRYAVGPQYVVDFSWTGEPMIQSYSSTTNLVRPYNKGYVGYNIPWAYNEQLSVGGDLGLWNNRLMASVDVYSVTSKNNLIGIPKYAEYGYTKSYEAGMDVNNRGIDVTLAARMLPQKKAFQWTSSLNFNCNKNKLAALPGGVNELVVGNRLLKVGEAYDQYWLLENEGMYFADDQVPVNPQTGRKLNYKGVDLVAGDPKWKDQNGDYIIDEKDQKLMGHILPVVSGGFNNSFAYKNWNFGVDFYFNLGRDIINQQMANRYDFINQENANNINSVKEITFWEKRGDYDRYPIYNPWSSVRPYRIEQDLFLEDASFLKLRTVTLGYDLTKMMKLRLKKANVTRFYVYGTANNLFTLTPYSGPDPELVSYTGYDTGYGLPIPRTYTLGVKMNL